MSTHHYQQDVLHVEEVSLLDLAKEYGTPCYVYSQKQLTDNFLQFDAAFLATEYPYKIHYAVKANSNLAILRLLHSLGAGFDTVSGGELERVLQATGSIGNTLFSGVGKSAKEIEFALTAGVHSIHVESVPELVKIQEIAAHLNIPARIALRINPEIAIDSHKHIITGNRDSKFGIAHSEAYEAYLLASRMTHIRCVGIACHIGSQIMDLAPFLAAIDQLLLLVKRIQDNGINLEYIDIGGGLGVRYKNEVPPYFSTYATETVDKIRATGLQLYLEPGRALVADTGILLSKVEYLKLSEHNNFAIIDAGMNDLMRPALYDSYHEILPVFKHSTVVEARNFQVVGPICESSDVMGHARMLQLEPEDIVAILTCGAYGFSMSSNYNTRPRCVEVLVNGSEHQLIRKRETIQDVLALECIYITK